MTADAAKSTAGPGHVAKSHKSFQPILPCGNKLLQQKWDQTYYEQHKKLITAAKPMVDSRPPPSRPHVTAKLKKHQVRAELMACCEGIRVEFVPSLRKSVTKRLIETTLPS